MDRVLEHTPLLGRSQQQDEEGQNARSDHVSFLIVPQTQVEMLEALVR